MDKNLLRLTACGGAAAIFIALFAIGGGFTPLGPALERGGGGLQTAATFFVQSITAQKLQKDYGPPDTARQKLKILIVPGHEPDAGGAQFGGAYERDIAVDIADDLAKLLSANPHYDAMVARTKTAWDPTLQSYFDDHAADIEEFRASQALQMATHLASGDVTLEADPGYHNTAPTDTALHLYGINKWAADNEYDLVLHLHINDYAGRKKSAVGKYDGFAIYVPDHQYSNSAASAAVGDALAARLNAYHATSTLPKESLGVEEDQELIATGSNNSADAAAVLIEYGYIYEPQFTDLFVLPLAESDYAYETYLGLQDFFNDSVAATSGTAALPYDWSAYTLIKGDHAPGAYALQAALHSLGLYPPSGKSLSDCPVSGYVGQCTLDAVAAFQTEQGLPPGPLGPETKAALTAGFKNF